MNSSFRKLLSLLFLTAIAAGCAAAPQALKEAPVFYPEAPDPPRVQFLTSFSGSIDFQQKKSAFDKFITGGKEVIARLDKPYGVAIYDGKIYVCDSNVGVFVFDLKNKTFGPLQGAQGRGKLVQPINISIDKDGNKYVSDPIRQQVVVFDKNDFFLKSYGVAGNWKPVDAVVYEDKLYVADIKNGEIKVFSLETGEVVQSLGRQGEKTDWLYLPTNLAFDRKGFLYVSDAGKFQVAKLDRDGNIRGVTGALGTQLGYFSRPRGIALDREDRLFAVDAAFDNVQIFTDDGQLLFFFGKAGSKAGDLFLPAKVAVDYNNIEYFRNFIDPSFEVDSLVLVTSQFGARLVSVYGIGKEKGKNYPSNDELKKIVAEKLKKQKRAEKEQPEKPEAEETPTPAEKRE